jgi:LPXTG-site transpeptidase (sortase) family protein
MKTIEPLNQFTPEPPAQSGPVFPLPKDLQGPGGQTMPTQAHGSNEAADLIRRKLDTIYSNEPSASAEAAEVAHLDHKPSKHQRFMQGLSASGKPLADIQTEWHNYYVSLPADEKHEVWQEFYANQSQSSRHGAASQTHEAAMQPGPGYAVDLEPQTPPAEHKPKAHRRKKVQARRVSDLKNELVGTVNKRSHAKLTARHHLQSLAFGVGVGTFGLLIMMSLFFNERFIAPFITPSRNVSSTPIIVDPNAVGIGNDPKVIIPKINVEIPVVYDEESIVESDVQQALERGVVHYATTANPGEKGNSVIFGHSSNNILNKGKYKFAFVLLSRLDMGDTFYLQKDGKRYTYKIFEKKIVKPTEIGVLDPVAGKTATATLITCDPPGTSLNRLVVVGEQISPDPNGNVASSAKPAEGTPQQLAGNSPSLWSRLTSIFR